MILIDRGQVHVLTSLVILLITSTPILASQGLRSALLIKMSRADRNPWQAKMIYPSDFEIKTRKNRFYFSIIK